MRNLVLSLVRKRFMYTRLSLVSLADSLVCSSHHLSNDCAYPAEYVRLNVQTLVVLFRSGRATSRALFEGHNQLREVGGKGDTSLSNTMLSPNEGGMKGADNVEGFRIQKEETLPSLGHLEDRFLRIALKISLYPISLILVNGIISGESSIVIFS